VLLSFDEPGSNDDALPEADDRHHRFDGPAHHGRGLFERRVRGSLPGVAHLLRRWIPPLETHAIIEYSHRLLATIAVILICLQAVVAWRQYRRVPQILLPSLAAVGPRLRRRRRSAVSW
jgi:hypothetical protein